MNRCEQRVYARTKGYHRGPLWPMHDCRRRAVVRITAVPITSPDGWALCRQHANQIRERMWPGYTEAALESR